MSARLLSVSLCLNLVLLGVAGYWAATKNSNHLPSATEPATQTNHVMKTSLESMYSLATPLRWSDLESADYPTYVANLRRAGCLNPILRQIINAELKELYAKKAFALVEEFQRHFWEIATRENVREYFDRTLRQQVKALCKESDTLVNQLVGEVPRESISAKAGRAFDSRLTAFLSPAKQEPLRRITERYEARLQAVRRADDLSSEEKTLELAELHRELESELAQILSAEERVEYQLRQSSAANEIQQLYGVDFSETELRNMAKAIDDYHRQTKNQKETDPGDSETLDETLQAVLGPERFADFNRSRSASYRELYEVVSDFNLPSTTAEEVFDLRLHSEKQSEAIRADKNRATEEKQELLDELQEQVEQTIVAKFGAEAFKSYKAQGGRWINSLGRL